MENSGNEGKFRCKKNWIWVVDKRASVLSPEQGGNFRTGAASLAHVWEVAKSFQAENSKENPLEEAAKAETWIKFLFRLVKNQLNNVQKDQLQSYDTKAVNKDLESLK
jgi:hypothetical protein